MKGRVIGLIMTGSLVIPLLYKRKKHTEQAERNLGRLMCDRELNDGYFGPKKLFYEREFHKQEDYLNQFLRINPPPHPELYQKN